MRGKHTVIVEVLSGLSVLGLCLGIGGCKGKHRESRTLYDVGGQILGIWRCPPSRIAVRTGDWELFEFAEGDWANPVMQVGLGGRPLYLSWPVSGGVWIGIEESLGGNKRVCVVEAETGRSLHKFPVPDEMEVRAFGASPDGDVIAWVEQLQGVKVGGADSVLFVVRMAEGAAPTRLTWRTNGAVQLCSVSQGGRYVAVDGVVWNTETKRVVLQDNAFYPSAQVWSGSGDHLYWVNSFGEIACWEIGSERGSRTFLKTVPAPAMVGYEADRLMATDVSPDDKLLAVSTEFSREVLILNAMTGEQVTAFSVVGYPVTYLRFDSDSNGIIFAQSQGGALRYCRVR